MHPRARHGGCDGAARCRAGRPTEPHEVEGHEWLLLFWPDGNKETTFRYCPLRAVAQGIKAKKPVTCEQPPLALSTPHWDTLFHAALADMGITALPSFVAEDALRSGRMERVLPDGHMMTMSIYAAMPTRMHIPARTRVLIDFLTETFGGVARDPWLRSIEEAALAANDGSIRASAEKSA